MRSSVFLLSLITIIVASIATTTTTTTTTTTSTRSTTTTTTTTTTTAAASASVATDRTTDTVTDTATATATATTNIKEKFEKWLTEFEIDLDYHMNVFGKSKSDVFETWIENEKFIIDQNNQNNQSNKTKLILGHNKFSGLNTVEFSKFMGFSGKYPLSNFEPVYFDTVYLNNTISNNTIYPESLDWRENGAVTNVKDQGNCGSCWSFSTTGALEGAYKVKTGVLKSFSEQQLVSCDNRENGGQGDHGCNGGLMDNAFTWIGKNNGLCFEEDYVYTSGTTGKNGECYKTCHTDALSTVVEYVDVKPNSDQALMDALLKGPVSVAIQANQRKFQMYKSGVLTGSECGNELDHGVLVVGWGTSNGTPYWIVKNSWSASWGQNGYILLERGTDANDGSGTCGILACASYPVL